MVFTALTAITYLLGYANNLTVEYYVYTFLLSLLIQLAVELDGKLSVFIHNICNNQ